MLPGWIFGVLAVVSLVGVGALGWLTWDEYGPSGDGRTVAAPTESETPSPTPSPTGTTPSPTPSPTRTTPSPTPSPTPEVSRQDIGVSVLNATRVQGLAAQVGGRVTQSGWTLLGVGNWRAGAAQTAVHYPAGREEEAELLAEDLGIGATAPAVQGMAGDRLPVLVVTVP